MNPPENPTPTAGRGGWPLAVLLVATFVIRAVHSEQPIVENYVGRQIPTAMVARNLERGSGFLRPELDTGPFPNLFLVEPPIFGQVVASVRPIFGLDRDATGRLVSAASVVLGAWGLFGLAIRREGPTVALLAVGSFALFPVMIRYGRACQPDALMIGCVLAGLRGWDEFGRTGRWRWAAFGGFVLSTGLALKITSAWVLIPFVLMLRRWPVAWRLAACGAMLGPSMAWYLHAWGDLARPAAGSLASSDNAAIWLRTLDPSAWLRLSTWSGIGRSLAVRSFTPVGFVLAILGSFGKPRLDRLWVGWAVGCGLAILGLAAKWHHAYYWMVVAPVVAVGMARGLAALSSRGHPGLIASSFLGSLFLALCAVQSASTWRTPPEWAGLPEAAREIRSLVPEGAVLIAPEALLYFADRRGFRLEFDPSAVRRAAGELGAVLHDPDDPLALVDLYCQRGGSVFEVGAVEPPRWFEIYPSSSTGFVADIGPVPSDGPRRAWREAIRSRPKIMILVDRPDLLIAELP